MSVPWGFPPSRVSTWWGTSSISVSHDRLDWPKSILFPLREDNHPLSPPLGGMSRVENMLAPRSVVSSGNEDSPWHRRRRSTHLLSNNNRTVPRDALFKHPPSHLGTKLTNDITSRYWKRWSSGQLGKLLAIQWISFQSTNLKRGWEVPISGQFPSH